MTAISSTDLHGAPPAAGEALAPWCELPCSYSPPTFRIKQATEAWEHHEAHALRRAVFCVEQGLFRGDDRDALDHEAQLLVACTCVAGECDQVVGTVRIHESAPGHWWGSRLAVHPSYRHAARDGGRLGATLIRLAVGMAHAQGATQFMAHVQAQNVPLFQALHWRLQAMVLLHGRPHGVMRASLAHYPPCATPEWGYLSLAQPTRRSAHPLTVPPRHPVQAGSRVRPSNAAAATLRGPRP